MKYTIKIFEIIAFMALVYSIYQLIRLIMDVVMENHDTIRGLNIFIGCFICFLALEICKLM